MLARPSFGRRAKKRSRPEGRLPFLDNPEFGLEEDDSTNLEDIHIVEALADFVLDASCIHTDEVNIDFLMLPPCEDVHRGRVDFLDRTETPTLEL